MKNTLFEIPLFKYQVKDWPEKKERLFKLISNTNLERSVLGNYFSDKSEEKSSYSEDFTNLFREEITQFLDDSGVSVCNVKNVWTVKYNEGDWQLPHNHQSVGFSGVLYVNFDNNEHISTIMVQPWNNYLNGGTQMVDADGKEGEIIFFPSFILHFTPPNVSNKERTVISFDIQV